MENPQAFLLFAFVAAVTPGPSNVMLTATGAQAGVLRGLPCLFGVGAGMGLMMALVALGLGALIVGSTLIAGILKAGGARSCSGWRGRSAARATPRPARDGRWASPARRSSSG